MPTFLYRRELSARELLPALGAGVGAGLVVAYLTQLVLRRGTLESTPPAPRDAARPSRGRPAAARA